MAKQHDAELCERIRVLEEKVRELESRSQYVYPYWSPHYCYPGCPYHQPYHYWRSTGTGTGDTITIGSDSTTSGPTIIGSTYAAVDPTVQYTLTDE